jgi:acyl-CoA thioesterase-1
MEKVMRHYIRLGHVYAGVLLFFIVTACSAAYCAQSASQMIAVAVLAKASSLTTPQASYASQKARSAIYPKTGLQYYTPEAQGIVCPPGKIFFISAFGDSLTSGYGLDSGFNAFPSVLQQTLRELGYSVVVENDGIAGNTTADARIRLPKVLMTRPDIVIVELGANDMLQHRSTVRMKNNLSAMIRKIKHADAKVLLAGMYALPHYGKRYADKFDAVFPDLAAKYNVVFYPFFLEGVALNHSLNQKDGHHPNAAGVKVIVRNIVPYVVKLMGAICKSTH